MKTSRDKTWARPKGPVPIIPQIVTDQVPSSGIEPDEPAGVEAGREATRLAGADNITDPGPIPGGAFEGGSDSTNPKPGPTTPEEERRRIVSAFKANATIPTYDPSLIPTCRRPDSYNNDLRLGCFTQSKYTWAGEQRKAMISHITDSTDAFGHAKKAMGLEFFLAKPAPLPGEIKDPIQLIQHATKDEALDFWIDQLGKFKRVVSDAATTHTQWATHFDRVGDTAPPSLRTVVLLHLMKAFDLGGDRRVKQFILGFPIVGECEQPGVFPRNHSKPPPKEIDLIWKQNSERSQLRARASGALNAQHLWDEALGQVTNGWLHPPAPLGALGHPEGDPAKEVVIAFRFVVKQTSKIRSCDDIEYSTTNEYSTTTTNLGPHRADRCRSQDLPETMALPKS